MSKLDFAEFFHAVHGMAPLPWQTRLSSDLTERARWPDLIDLPTASGKTACIDIAVFHLAWCAARGEPWLAARRIALVVDRRIIVDAAFERAERIRNALENSKHPAVVAVADALLKLGGERPLCCQKLRGGVPHERGFALHPAQPMVITSTMDQIGSRLLFRGYGLSQYAQPLHAGLLGHDTLILLDEAHLGEPFIQTIAAIQREQARACRQLLPLRPTRLVSLSATARTSGERFQLSEGELAHPLIAQRRTATKPARLVGAASSSAERMKILLREALATYSEIESPAPAIAVIVNRVATARELFAKLQAQPEREFEIELVIGRSRPLDRDEIAKRLIARTATDRDRIHEDKGLIVVATQAIEVGADLDFQGLVTECAALDALRQRFGRLDRIGRFGGARAVIVGNADQGDDPVYGAALSNTWLWLQTIAKRADGAVTVDFSIASIDAALQSADVSSLIIAPRETLQLTPAHVQLLCQTSPRPMYDPDVSTLLHGFHSGQAEVQVVWRADIPARCDEQRWSIERDESELIDALLSINPPSSLETLSLPLHAVRTWLAGTSVAADFSDIEGTSVEREENSFAKGKSTREVWRRVGKGWQAISASAVRPGDTIVVPSVYGGCDEFGFAPASDAAVADLCQRAREALHREMILVVTPETLKRQFGPERAVGVEEAWRTVTDGYESEESTSGDLLRRLLEALGMSTAAELGSTADPVVEFLSLRNGALRALILRSGVPGSEDISDEDLSSSHTVAVTLDSHNAGVGKRARELAHTIGLDSHYSESLGSAGDTHDLGKADPRFQRLLRAGDDDTLQGQLLAKGLRRAIFNRIELTERHEAYSVALLKAYPDLLKTAPDPDLALYLAGTHHGRGRALMPIRTDDGTHLELIVDGKTLRFDGTPDLGALSSNWSSLFWQLNERYGPWGIAYLEAVLRLADHLQSRDELGALATS